MQSVDADRVLAAAAAGNDIAWSRIVDSSLGEIWRIARSAGLSNADASEVCQLAWLRLSQRLSELASLEQVARFLTDTVRREAGALAAQRLEQERRRAGATLPDNVILLAPGFAGTNHRADKFGDTAPVEPPGTRAVTMRPLVDPAWRGAEAGTDYTAPADVSGQTSVPPR